ncbi:hypothetical protein IscW_ISCW006442, partial [Ixodes scapularis]
ESMVQKSELCSRSSGKLASEMCGNQQSLSLMEPGHMATGLRCVWHLWPCFI